MKSGIYKILNIVTEKVYIGSATELNKRIIQHKSNLNNNRHVNALLQNSWNLHGGVAFKFEIIEFCEKEKLIEREQHWMDFYKCYEKGYGYNLRPKAENNLYRKQSLEELQKRKFCNLGFRHSEQSKLRMSQSAKGKPKSEEHKDKLRIARLGVTPKHRNFEKWPCPDAAKCKCHKCNFTRAERLREYRKTRVFKERKVYEVFIP